jgi:DNA polymerase-4
MPVTAIPGVGDSTAASLREAGIRTVGQLATLDDSTARELVGSWGPDLVARARGIDERPVSEEHGAKSVSSERTFPHDVRERDECEAHLRSLVERVARRLRQKGIRGRTVTVKLRYADFTTRTASRTLPTATDLDAPLLECASALLSETWTPGAGLRLLGFGVSGFSERGLQLGLLAEEPTDDGRSRALAQSIDAVRARFGDAAITHGLAEDDTFED